MILPHPTPILVERHIQYPMERILYPPMASDRFEKLLRTYFPTADVIVLLTTVLIAGRSFPHYHDHAPKPWPLGPLPQRFQVGQYPAGPQLLPPVAPLLLTATAASGVIVLHSGFLHLLAL